MNKSHPQNRAQDCKAPERNLWPWGIILAFVLFIMGTVSLVALACSQKMDLVSSDYYEQEIKFQNQLDQLGRARALNSDASISYEPATQSIRIALPIAHVREGVTGSIQLYRPSAAGLDRRIKLEPDPTGSQRLAVNTLLPGLWKVRVCWTSGEKEYRIDQSVVIESNNLATPASLQRSSRMSIGLNS
jgi:hypothetical protein